MTDQTTPVSEVPTGWLKAVIDLLDQMAGEGIFMACCDDPADLMSEIANHLGVGDADDPWQAVKEKYAFDG